MAAFALGPALEFPQAILHDRQERLEPTAIDFGQRAGRETVIDFAAPGAGAHQPSAPKDAEVLGNSRSRDREAGGDLSGG